MPSSPWFVAALALGALVLPAPARAEPPGPFLALSVGGGDVGDAAGLTGGGLGLRGRLEVGYGDGRFLAGALGLVLSRSSYTNDIPPPEMIVPEVDLRLTRIGFGAAGDVRLPLGRVTPSLGAGATIDRFKATARGVLLGIRGNYFEESDVGVTVEARAGVDLRVHAAVLLGVRAGWSWSRADLEELTDGSEWLNGPWLELRVAFDTSGFFMTSAP